MQRGGHLFGLGVVQVVDVDGAVARRNVELAQQVAEPLERLLAGDHDQLVGPFVGDDLRGRRGGGSRRRRARPGATLRLQDLGQLARQVLRAGMPHRDHVDLLRSAGLVELLDQLLQPPHVQPEVGEDHGVGREDLEIGVARNELRQDVAHLIRFHEMELEQLRHHLLGGGRLLAAVQVGGDLRARRLLFLHQLPVAPHRVDRPVVRIQRGEEHAPDLVGGNGSVGEDGDLPRHALGQDEVALGELADELDHLGQVALVERHQHRSRILAGILVIRRRGGGGRQRSGEQMCEMHGGDLRGWERCAHRPKARGRCARCG